MSEHTYERHNMASRPFIFHHDTPKVLPIAMHWHNEIEFLYIVGGTTAVTIGSNTFKAAKGDLFAIPARMVHSMSSEDGLSDYYTLIVDYKYLKSLNLKPETVYFKNPIVSEPARIIFKNIVYSYYEERTFPEIKTLRYVLELCTYFFENHAFRILDSKTSTTYEIVDFVFNYISENYKKQFTVAGVASKIGMSESYVAHIFKKETGMSLISFVNYYRVTTAQKLIREGNHLSDVAEKCGFSNQYYFSKVFKRITHQTPLHYAKTFSRTITEYERSI